MGKTTLISLIIIILSIVLVCLFLINQYYWKLNMGNETKLVFNIDGQIVEQSKFEEERSKLDIPKEYKYTSTIEGVPANPAVGFVGIPAGSEVVYEATDRTTGKRYLYIEITYPNQQVFEIRAR